MLNINKDKYDLHVLQPVKDICKECRMFDQFKNKCWFYWEFKKECSQKEL